MLRFHMLGLPLLAIGGLCVLAAAVRFITIPDLLGDSIFKGSVFAASVALGIGVPLVLPLSLIGVSGQLATGAYVFGIMGLTAGGFWGAAFLRNEEVSLRRMASGQPDPSPSADVDDDGYLAYERDIEHENTGSNVRRRRIRATSTGTAETADAQVESPSESHSPQDPSDTSSEAEASEMPTDESPEPVDDGVDDEIDDEDTFFGE